MSYGYQQPRQAPERRRSWAFTCLASLAALVFLLLALAVGALLYLKPRLSQGAGETLGGQLDAMIDEKLGQELGGGGGQVPPGFAEQIVISDAEVNAYIAANPADIAPLDAVTVAFVPGEMLATVSAYGVSGTAHAGLAATGGTIVLVNPRIDGPLGYVIDANQLAQSLEGRLNQELQNSGARVSAVDIAQGQISATVEGR